MPEGVWAVLVAAGRGERLGGDRPKAFAPLAGLPLLAESLRRLDDCEWVDGIVVVAPPGWEEQAALLAEEIGASKVSSCVAGGESRSGSVRIGLAEVPDDAAVVLVHDAARPIIPPEVVPRLLEALREGFDGAVPTVPVADTVKRAQGGVVVETLLRDELVAVQTPQAFVADVLRAAAAGEGRRSAGSRRSRDRPSSRACRPLRRRRSRARADRRRARSRRSRRHRRPLPIR